MERATYLDLRLGEFLDRLAAAEGAPGGGSGAALTVAFAGALVAMVARASLDSWEEAAGVAAQAQALAERAAALADRDAAAWEEALAALRAAGAGRRQDPRRDFRLEQALEQAAAAPLEIAALAADAAALSALAGERGDPTYRADAAAAAALAAGGARAAAHLVEINLGVRPEDERLARARACADAAAAAAERLLEHVP